MRPSFRGFEAEEETNSSTSQQTTESTSGLSEYDTVSGSSSGSSRDTSPTSVSSEQPVTVQKKQHTKSIVRRLVDHFSHSDSENTEEASTSTGRRGRRVVTHTELPRGGERELRKKMAEQNQANEAIKLFKALSGILKETMDEACQALDRNESKGSLIGHKAAVVSLEAEFDLAWQKVEPFFGKPGVEVDQVQLVSSKSRSQARARKVKGHIDSLALVPTATEPTTIAVVNQTSFGHLDLPTFSGDYTEYENFEGNFRSLIESANLDDGKKRAFLISKIQGDAKAYIGQDGLASKSYEDIWAELKSRFGKPWRITRATVKKLLDIPDPANTPTEITRYWNNLIEVCKMAERRKLTAAALILNVGLLKLPVDFRSKMDDKLKPLSEEYILTREIIAEPFNDVIAGELDRPNTAVATFGFNTTVAGNSYNKNSQGQGQYAGKTKRFTCLLCGKNKQTHKTWQCPVFNTGQQNRDRMMKLGRCINCAVAMNEHGTDCTHRAQYNCSIHPTQRHLFWLCSNFANPSASKALQAAQQNGWQSQQQYLHQQAQQGNLSQGQMYGQGQGFSQGQGQSSAQGQGQNFSQGQGFGQGSGQGQGYGQNFSQGQNRTQNQNSQGGKGNRGYHHSGGFQQT